MPAPITDDEVAALIARYAALATDPFRASKRWRIIDQLGAAVGTSEAALTLVIEALLDPEVDVVGTGPHDAWVELLAEHAYVALRPIAERAAPQICARLPALLDRGDTLRTLNCRRYALALLSSLAAPDADTRALLDRYGHDP
jgi:hypothetical protein